MKSRRSLSMVGAMLLALTSATTAQELSTIDEQPPFTMSGSIEGSLAGYSSSGIDREYAPFRWLVSGSLSPVVYGIEIPLGFTIGEEEREFRQPFNQFGISPSYKWVTLHLGHRSIPLSRYTLAGATMFGVGAELKPGNVRLSAMYGQLQRAVEEDTTESLAVPAYERMGWAAGLEYSTEGGSFEMSMLKASDDTMSIRRPVYDAVMPAGNTAIAMGMSIRIIDELKFEAEGGASLLTRDLGSDSIASSDIPEFLSSFQTINQTSSFTIAGRASLNFAIPHFGIGIGYERIEPGFATLGAYYFASDIENWTVTPRFDAFEGALRVNGSIGVQRDNLLGTKVAETQRVIGNGSIGWTPSETFGIDFRYGNYSTGQSAGRRPLNDSVLLRNVTQSGAIAPRLNLQGDGMTHSISATAELQSYTDLGLRGEASNNESKQISLGYALALTDQPTTGSAYIYYGDAEGAGITTTMVGGSVGGNTAFFDDKLSVNATLGASWLTSNLDEDGGAVLNESVGASWSPTEDDSFTLSFNATQSGAATRYDELGAVFSYRRTFSIGE